MKKQVLFLTLFLLAAVSAIFAQTPPVKQLWLAQKDPAREEKAQVQREHLALTPSGELYAAGRFSSTFSFAGSDVEAIAGSSYLLKYDAKGKEKWAVAIQGAVSPTAITLAENGDVYLAASFNDKIRLNTTSGSPVELSGRAASDELPNAFIACYSPDGALKHHSLFKPDSVIDGVFGVRFVVRKMLTQDGKIYIAAESFGANVKNGSVTFSGSYMNFLGFAYYSLNKVFVAELDATATVTRILLDAGPEAGGDVACHAVTPSLALDKEGNLFAGFVANGNQKIKIGGNTESRKYFVGGDGTFDFHYVLAAIKLSDLSFRLNESKVRHNKENNLCRISNLEVAGDKLLVFGTFNDSLPYNHKIKAVAADDAFIAGLKKTDLSLLFSAASGIKEGDDPRYFEENIFGSGVWTSYASMVVNTVDTRPTGGYLKSYELVYDLTKNSLSVSPTSGYMGTGFTVANNLIAGSALDKLGASAKLNFLVAVPISNSVKALENLSMEVYPRATADVVNFSETCDVEVNNLSGQCLKKFEAVSAVDLSDLPKGLYILLLSTKEGTASVKVIRK